MNIFLWILQIALALHTIFGALWKFSNSEQSVVPLAVIPHGVWQGLGVIELLCSLCLILPAVNKRLAKLAPIAATFITAEMFLYCVLHIFSGAPGYGHVIYWLVVGAISGFIAWGRFTQKA